MSSITNNQESVNAVVSANSAVNTVTVDASKTSGDVDSNATKPEAIIEIPKIKLDASSKACATGRRKESVARVRVKTGNGKIMVNNRSVDEYFGVKHMLQAVYSPLKLLALDGALDISCNVNGGGISGQAGAIRHGISKALLELNAGFRIALRGAGFLTRDSRMVERKKSGHRKARKTTQFSKR